MNGKIWMVLLMVAAVAGCKTPVYVQSDESVNLAKYKTYSWVQTRANQDDNRNLTAFAADAVHQAVNAELASRGYVEVQNNPELLVSYDLLVEKATAQRAAPVYTQPYSRVYYNPYLRRWGTVYYPSQFAGYDAYEVSTREGTLTVTLLDAQTDKTVWQAWTTEELSNSKLTKEEIAGSVRNIFKKF
jgi:hypothetical protein